MLGVVDACFCPLLAHAFKWVNKVMVWSNRRRRRPLRWPLVVLTPPPPKHTHTHTHTPPRAPQELDIDYKIPTAVATSLVNMSAIAWKVGVCLLEKEDASVCVAVRVQVA